MTVSEQQTPESTPPLDALKAGHLRLRDWLERTERATHMLITTNPDDTDAEIDDLAETARIRQQLQSVISAEPNEASAIEILDAIASLQH